MRHKIVIATGNQDKMREIREIFADLDAEILSMKEAGAEADPDETGTTFAENALIKAEAVPNRVDEAEKISRAKYILISGFLGLFLSLAYLTGRYYWRVSKKQ